MLFTLPLHILSFLVGMALVVWTLRSAILTFVLPRGVSDRLTGSIFVAMRFLFNLWLGRLDAYEDRDRVMALFSPLTLLALPLVWLALVLVGYTAMFWGVGAPDWGAAFSVSGSSLLTLGFATDGPGAPAIMTFTEAALGLLLAALLVAYLPTMYTAWSRREAAVTMLEVRAGSPPSAVEMIARFHRIGRLDNLADLWTAWEAWFVDIEESHTSLAALAFFRSPQPDRSWVTAAGTILDAAALLSSTVQRPRDAQAELTIRAGYIALRRIGDFFGIASPAIPTENDPSTAGRISITRGEFDAAYDQMAGIGVPLKPDRAQAWRDFAGWRITYDAVLLALALLTMAPEAPWSSDRAFPRQRSVATRIMRPGKHKHKKMRRA